MKHWQINSRYLAIKKILHIELLPKRLDHTDCIVMTTLLEGGYPFDLIQRILKTQKNEKLFNQVKDKLENGIPIEEALYPILPKDYQKSFLTFIEVLSLSKCLKQCHALALLNRQMSQYWLKNVLPSVLLILLSCVGLVLFKAYGIEIMEQMANSFHQELPWLTYLDLVLSISIFTLSLIIIILTLLVILLSIPKVNRFLLMHINNTKKNLLVLKVSYDFALVFNACLKQGVNTYQTISIMLKSKDYLVSLIASMIHEALQQGNSFINALHATCLDDTLIRFIELSMYSNSVSEALDAYQTSCSDLIQRKCRQSAKFIQTVTYLLMGGLIVCIYQVLFLPMQIMTTL